jgi:hypothetical protein
LSIDTGDDGSNSKPAYSVRCRRESDLGREAPHGLLSSRLVSTILLDEWLLSSMLAAPHMIAQTAAAVARIMPRATKSMHPSRLPLSVIERSTVFNLAQPMP